MLLGRLPGHCQSITVKKIPDHLLLTVIFLYTPVADSLAHQLDILGCIWLCPLPIIMCFELTCAKRREFSGMIHWLTIKNHPSNPQQPIHSHQVQHHFQMFRHFPTYSKDWVASQPQFIPVLVGFSVKQNPPCSGSDPHRSCGWWDHPRIGASNISIKQIMCVVII